MIDRAVGLLLTVIAIAVLGHEWLGSLECGLVAAVGVLAFLVVATPGVRTSRKAFVAIGLVLLAIAFATRSDWFAIALDGLDKGAFIAAFFIALASLRNPAISAPSIERCGEYLASQPPGKRYLALTFGGHLFALILSYGSISLLGGLTESITSKEPDEEIRNVRNRRMLLAIQRGFVASLTWSPLAFAMAISTSLVPGSSWSGAAPFAIANAVLVTFVGWSLDTLYKPKLSHPVARTGRETVGSIADLRPLLVLLVLLFAGVAALELLTGLRIIALVMLLVPALSVAWIVVQSRAKEETHPDEPGRPTALRRTLFRLRGLVEMDFPSYRSELVLLVMAGIIGSVGGTLLQPLIAGQSALVAEIPAWLLLPALVWFIPILGQAGMNPILSVSLLAPLLPSPEALGVRPAALIVALTAGWALTGASSPFTATTLLVGRLGHTTALRVGLVWNGPFMLLAGSILSLSVLMATLV